MVYGSIRHIAGTVSRQSEPEPQVDVLEVAEKVLVEPPHFVESRFAIEGSGGTGGENFGVLVISGCQAAAMSGPPRQATDVVDIPQTINEVGRAGEHLPGAKGRGVWVGAGGIEQRRKPARFGEGIGIQDRNELVVAHRNGPVVGRGEAEILPGHVKQNPWSQTAVLLGQLPCCVCRAVRAAVVDHDDPRGQNRLCCEARKTSRQAVAAVEVDDDDGHVCGATVVHAVRAQKVDARDAPAVATANGRPAASLIERIGCPTSGQSMPSTGSFQATHRSPSGK